MGELKFQLDNPSASYFAGQVITGCLHVTFQTQKVIKGIKLKCLGKGHVHWSEGSGKNRRSYSSNEDYFCNKTYFLGNAQNEDVRVEAGKYVYPFAFQLPRGIPSAYESSHGWIRYNLEATIKKGMFKFNVTTELMFTVNGIVDLNIHPAVNAPIEISKEKNVCCLWCKSGPVGFVLKIPKIGFVPGEYLRFQAEISNNTSKKITEVDIRIKQEVEYRSSSGRKKTSYSKVLEIRGPEIAAWSNEIWQSGDNANTKITPLPPTNLGGGGIIGLHYIIELILKIRDAVDLTGGIPLIIGTIPLRNEFGNFTSVSPQQSLEQNYYSNNSGQESIPMTTNSQGPPPYPSSAPPAYGAYPDMPPPDYATAVKMERFVGADNDDETSARDTTHFLPKYATYGWTIQH